MKHHDIMQIETVLEEAQGIRRKAQGEIKFSFIVFTLYPSFTTTLHQRLLPSVPRPFY